MSASEQKRVALICKKMKERDFQPERFLETGYDAVAIHASSSIITANSAACEMFGYTLQELTGMNAWLLFSPESGSTLMAQLIKRSTEPYQVIARHKDGSTFPVELKGHNFVLDDEQLRSVLIRRLDQ